jgi:hypothetical protein
MPVFPQAETGFGDIVQVTPADITKLIAARRSLHEM